MNGDGDDLGCTKSIEDRHKNAFYKDQLEKLEKENQQLKLMKDSLRSHLNFLMKKIRNIKLAKTEDLSEAEEEYEGSKDTFNFRFSITESVGLSSRCYTALFDSLEDLSINQGNDEFLVAGLDQLSTESSDSSSSYIDLNTYSPSPAPAIDQPPQVHIARKRMLSPIHDSDIPYHTFSFSKMPHINEPIMLPEDLKSSVLSPEIVIKSPRRSNRINRSRTRVIENGCASISPPTSPEAANRVQGIGGYFTVNVPGTPSSSQASPLDIIRSYHSAQDRVPLDLMDWHGSADNPWTQAPNPIAELIQYLQFYTFVRGVPRLAKETACKVQIQTNLPSGSSSSFEVGETTLNPFNMSGKINTTSPLDTEEAPIGKNNYSELPCKGNNFENECESNVSMEYCLPPDEGSTYSNNQSALRSPEQPHYSKTVHAEPLPVSHERQILRKGVLRKLNKKFKVWSNFFCILTTKGLFFYNIKHQPQPEDFFFIQKSVKEISVDIMKRIDVVKSDKSKSDFFLGSFEIVSSSDKHYTLATGDHGDCRDWIKCLRSVILQQRAGIVMHANASQLLHKGWVTRVKWGYSKKLWCCLMGAYLVYFDNKDDYFPTGYRKLTNSTINTNASVSRNTNTEYNSVGSEISDSLDYPDVFFTISICQENATPIFLCIETEHELRLWSHYLRISIQNITSDDIDNERPVNFTEVIRPEYHDRFYYSSEEIGNPVAMNTNVMLKNSALQIWKALERLGSLEHYSIRKECIKEKFDRITFLVQACAQEPGLKDELYLQLMKQTQTINIRDNRAYQSRRSKFSFLCGGDNFPQEAGNIHDYRIKSVRDSEFNAILNMWECLSLLIPICLPSMSISAILKTYLVVTRDTSASDSQKEVQKYASYCLDQLTQVKKLSGRSRSPSQFEITSISMRNPYTHSLPFSLPIYVQSESYQVISFNALSSVQMITDSMMHASFPPEIISTLQDVCLFALYLYQPSRLVKYTFLNPDTKICDVISKFEDYFSKNQSSQTSFESVGGVKLFFRCQALRYTAFLQWYDRNADHCQEVLKMLCFQIHADVKEGHYSLSGFQLLDLVSYLYEAQQLENAAFSPSEQSQNLFISRLMPAGLAGSHDNLHRLKSILQSRGRGQPPDPAGAYLQYLRIIKETCDHQLAPTSLPSVATRSSDCLPAQQLMIICQETSISFLDHKCRICLKKIPFMDVLSFGSSSQHFLIAYSLLPARKCFKRVILHLPDHCCSLELSNSILFYSTKLASQDS